MFEGSGCQGCVACRNDPSNLWQLQPNEPVQDAGQQREPTIASNDFCPHSLSRHQPPCRVGRLPGGGTVPHRPCACHCLHMSLVKPACERQGFHCSQLTGTLPPEMSHLTKLEWLRVFGKWPVSCTRTKACFSTRGCRDETLLSCSCLASMHARVVLPIYFAAGWGVQVKVWDQPPYPSHVPVGIPLSVESAAKCPSPCSLLPACADNQLEGTIPPSYSRLNPRLTQVSIGGNKFSGKPARKLTKYY